MRCGVVCCYRLRAAVDAVEDARVWADSTYARLQESLEAALEAERSGADSEVQVRRVRAGRGGGAGTPPTHSPQAAVLVRTCSVAEHAEWSGPCHCHCHCH